MLSGNIFFKHSLIFSLSPGRFPLHLHFAAIAFCQEITKTVVIGIDWLDVIIVLCNDIKLYMS